MMVVLVVMGIINAIVVIALRMVIPELTFFSITLTIYVVLNLILSLMLLVYSIVLGRLLSTHIKESQFVETRRMRIVMFTTVGGSLFAVFVSIIQTIGVFTNLDQVQVVILLGFMLPMALYTLLILLLVFVPSLFQTMKSEEQKSDIQESLLGNETPKIYDEF